MSRRGCQALDRLDRLLGHRAKGMEFPVTAESADDSYDIAGDGSSSLSAFFEAGPL